MKIVLIGDQRDDQIIAVALLDESDTIVRSFINEEKAGCTLKSTFDTFTKDNATPEDHHKMVESLSEQFDLQEVEPYHLKTFGMTGKEVT